MRISDWSSDVCSSDLDGENGGKCVGEDMHIGRVQVVVLSVRRMVVPMVMVMAMTPGEPEGAGDVHAQANDGNNRCLTACDGDRLKDRTRVVSGECVSVREDLGGPSTSKKKHQQN